MLSIEPVVVHSSISRAVRSGPFLLTYAMSLKIPESVFYAFDALIGVITGATIADSIT